MLPDLTESMKKAAMMAMESAKPMNIAFGTVVSVNPLMISVEQKMTLGRDQLILTRNVTDYDVDVTVDWTTDSALKSHRHGIEEQATDIGGDPPHVHGILPSNTGYASLSHQHGISGRDRMRIHLGLNYGERVVLLRVQGGQKYLVWDRVV